MSCPVATFAALREKGIPVADDEVETARLALLKSLDIVGSDERESFDRITSLVRATLQVPVALVSLVDTDKQWFLSNVTLFNPEGTALVQETPRDQAFCNFAIDPDLKTDIFLVPDATKDPRFANNPLVTSFPQIRFYAGAPLMYTTKTGEVYRLGSLCAIDMVPHDGLDIRNKQVLLDLAALVVDEIQLRARLNNDLIQAQARYIASTAHNLRTPLMVFELSLALLQESNPTKEQEEAVSYAQMSVEMMRMTVENSINVARSMLPKNDNVPKFCPTIGPINILKLQKKISNLVEKLFASEVPLVWSMDEHMKRGIIYSDESVVTHCMLNLLSNACKFTTRGSIVVTLSFCTDGRQGRAFRVEVADTGPGLKHKRPSVFEPFADHDDTKEGTGLGLFSMRYQVTNLGGTLGCDTNVKAGMGSVFWFELPDLRGSFEADHKLNSKDLEIVSSPPSEHPPLKRFRVPDIEPITERDVADAHPTALIIDDSSIIRVLLAKVLSKLGFGRIDQAANGSNGLQMMVQNPTYSVVFMDFLMPVMTGVECVTKFRQWESFHKVAGRTRQIIVGISANASTADVDLGLSSGMDRFVNKPLSLQCVKEIVDSLPKTSTQ